MKASNWKFDFFLKWADVEDKNFIEQWSNWIESSKHNHIFNHPLLVKIWSDVYQNLHNIKPFYVIASAGNMRVFFPLVLWKRNYKNGFLRMIVPAGYSDYDYHDPLVNYGKFQDVAESFWIAFINFLYDQKYINYDLIHIPGITSGCRGDNWFQGHEVCPYLNIRSFSDYDDYFMTLKRKLRSELRRFERRLTEVGTISYHVYEKSDVQIALNSLMKFLDVHKQKWPYAYKPKGFHEALITRALPNNLISLNELRINEIPVSWQLNFKYNKILYGYMMAVVNKSEISRLGVGSLHLNHSIKECFEKKYIMYDFLKGDEVYKSGWANERKSMNELICRNNRYGSKIRLLLFDKLQSMK